MNVKILDGDRSFCDYACCVNTGIYKWVPFSYVDEHHITDASVHTASYNSSFAEQSNKVELLQSAH